MKRAYDWLSGFFGGDEAGRGRAPLFFALLTAAFYLDKLLFGPFAPVRLHDVFDSDFFRYRALAELGPLVQWYPNYAGGMPAYAWHHTPFYPLVLLASFVPPWAVYSAMVLALMFAAGWGMYRLLKEHAGLTPQAAAWGGAFFAVVSQVQQNSIPSTVFNYAFPLFFCWFVDVWRARGSLRSLFPPLLGLNVVLALSYPVLTMPYFPLAQLFLLMLFTGKYGSLAGDRRGLLAWYFVLWTGYVTACSPVLYSLLKYIPLACKRGEVTGTVVLGSALPAFFKTSGQMLLSSVSRAGLLVPLFAGLGLAGRFPRLRGYYAAIAAVALVSGFYSSEIAGLLRGSIFLKMDLGHFFWTLPFLAALTASTAAGMLFRGERAGLAFEAALLGFAALAFFLWTGQVHRSVAALNIASGALFLLLMKRERAEGLSAPDWAAWLLLAVGAGASLWSCKAGAQLYLNVLFYALAACWLAARAPELARPGRRAAYWAAMLAVLFVVSARFARSKGEEPEADRYLQTAGYSGLKQFKDDSDPSRAASFGLAPFAAISQGLETADARGPVFSGPYKDYFKLILMPQLADKAKENFFDSYWYNLYFYQNSPGEGLNFDLARAGNIRYIISPESSDLLLARSDGVSVVPSDLESALGRFRPLLERSRLGRKVIKRYFSGLYVYRLKGAFPRAYFAGGARLFAGKGELLAALSSAGLQELSSAVFLERDGAGDVQEAAPRARAVAKVRQISYSPGRAVYSLDAQRGGLLVFVENYHPGWRAAVDGAPVRLLRANHAFMAVPVPAGRSEVVFDFRSHGAYAALAALLAGFLLINLPPLFKP